MTKPKIQVTNLLSKANLKLSVPIAAALLVAATTASTLLGLLRERLLLANFGISAEVDAYKAAFTVPDFMFMLLVSGALSVTFIPVFTQRLASGNRQSAWQLSSSLINLLALITGFASILIIVFAPQLVHYVVAPGLSDATKDLAADMMRIIALNPLLFAISSVLTSMQQAVGRFFFYALAPSLYNLGIISGILFIAPHVGITGVAIGVLIGSVIQLIAAIIGMSGLGYKYEPNISWRNQGFRQVLGLLPARSVDQGIDYINILVETNIASRLKEGAITAYQTAFTLHLVPISLIGVAISTAAFPQLSRRLAQKRPDLFRKELTSVMRAIIWLVLPTAVIAYFGRGYLVRLLVADGNATIASLLGLLVAAIAFRSVFHLLTRSYYAQQDTKTPLIISIFSIGLGITLAIYLAKPQRYGIQGLAIAQSISAAFEAIILIAVLIKRMKGLVTSDLIHGLVRMVSATGLMAFVSYTMIAYVMPLQASDVGFFALVPKFATITLVSLGSYVVFSYMFGIREADPVVEQTKKLVFKPIRTN
jgi:putative peptidoglycan lipid II flippase